MGRNRICYCIKNLLTTIGLLCLLIPADAQRTNQAHKVDSLLKLLAVAKEDTGKAMILLTLSSWYETNNQDSATYYLNKGKELSEALKFNVGIFFDFLIHKEEEINAKSTKHSVRISVSESFRK